MLLVNEIFSMRTILNVLEKTLDFLKMQRSATTIDIDAVIVLNTIVN